MLDKSVPFADILMQRKKGAPIVRHALPEGFRFAHFRAGDEKAWAQIEASVLEFADEIDALLYFQKTFMAYLPELERRCLFVETAAGEKVATATAWWGYSGTRRDPLLHWVGCKPQYQGLGLGKAVTARAIELMLEIEGDRDFYLHTQTWSHKAVGIYESLGFSITAEKNLHGYSNENCEKALAILAEVRAAR